MSIKKYCFFFMLFSVFTKTKDRPFTIMLDPFGDAKLTGRVINDTFERGITLQCAEYLKKTINAKIPHIRVVLTRVPGETIKPLQNASFANRLDIDLYLNISLYPEQSVQSHISLYYYLTNPITDFWHKPEPLTFYHVDDAHLKNLHETKELGNILLKILQNPQENPHFKAMGLFGIPIKPLVGITAPALTLEVGIKQNSDYKFLTTPILNFIESILE